MSENTFDPNKQAEDIFNLIKEKDERISQLLNFIAPQKKGRKVTFKRDLSIEQLAYQNSLPDEFKDAYHKMVTEPYVSVHTYWGEKIRYILKVRQQNRCYLCKMEFDRDSISLDHSHKDGMIRGLIHQRCNLLIGKVEAAAESSGVSITEMCAMINAYINQRDE